MRMQQMHLPGRSNLALYQGYGHGERIFDVAFHPLDNDILASASEDQSVRLWRLNEGDSMYRQVRAYLGHGGEALRVAWSGNGLLLASGSADRTVRLWAADLGEAGYTGRQLAVLDGHPEEVYHVEFVDPTRPPQPSTANHLSSDDNPTAELPGFESHILAASSESLFMWSLREGALVQQADAPGTSGSTLTQDDIMAGARPAYIFGVSRQPGGSLVAAACCDGRVRLWSMRPTGHLEWVGAVELPPAGEGSGSPAGPAPPMCVGCAFAADGTALAVAARDGRLFEVDVRAMRVRSCRPLPSPPLGVSYLPPPLPPPAGPAGQTSGPAGGAEGGGGGGGLWLVSSRDGAVYGYAVGGPGTQLAAMLRPPSGPGVAVLVAAVARGGGAVALGGEPQDTSLLPKMRPGAQTSPPSAPGNGGKQEATAPPAAAAAAAAGAPAAGAPQALQPSPAAVARAAAGAPARRRGGGASRAAAGGGSKAAAAATGDPLFGGDGGEAREQRGALGGVAEGLASMRLAGGAASGGAGEGGGGAAGGGSAGGGAGAPRGAAAHGGAAGGGAHGRGAGHASMPAAPAAGMRMRAPLFVYRAAGDG